MIKLSRNVYIVIAAISLSGCQTGRDNHDARYSTQTPSEQQVSDGTRYSVVFEVVPGPDGYASSCRMVEVREIQRSASGSEFIPSPEYISTACDSTLGQRSNWIPQTDSSGTILPVEEECFWSEAVPDSPICRAELAMVFAEEIPRGIGKTVVFELAADAKGAIASCTFAGSYDLAGAEQLDLVPHGLYVKDGCRKLESVRWENSSIREQQAFYMPCRYIDEVPSRAFCERQFGE